MLFKFKKEIRASKQVYLVFVFILIFLCFLIWLFSQPFRDNVQSAVGTYFNKIFSIRSDILNIGESFFSTSRLKFENSVLLEENSLLKTKVLSSNNINEENEILRKQLGLKIKDSNNLVLAYISYPDANPFNENVILNVGSGDNVKVGDLAIVANALVGKILSVSAHTSELELITDNHAIYPIVIKSISSSKGISQGKLGENTLTINNVLKSFPVNVGDLIILSSDLNYFTNSELLIGSVSEISDIDNEAYKEIKAIPALDLTNLKRVFIIT